MAIAMGQVKGRKYPISQPIATKKCNYCGKVLPVEEFARNKDDRGRHPTCKRCEERKE